MAQSGYTPILIYASGTAAALPSAANLTSSANGAELALNYADGKLYYKNSAGTVTLLADKISVSVASANGFAGSVAQATATSTPAITISTSVTGVLVGNGTAVAAAVSGTDFKTINSTSILGSGNISVTSAPGGSTTQVQYNNAGAFGGSANFVFDGTNVGIGTSSPSTSLHVVGSSSAITATVSSTSTTINGAPSLKVINTGSSTTNQLAEIQFRYEDGTYNANGAIAALRESGTARGQSFIFAPSDSLGNAAERMRIDSAGMLGLGLTPSSWYTGGPKYFQLTGDVGFAATTNNSIRFNNYVNTTPSDVYYGNGYAGRYTFFANSGQHVWYTAPSGTAGNAITFTQAMTLDASGNLGVGTTSISGAANTNVQVKNSGSAALRVTGGSGTGFDVLQDSGGVAYLWNRDNNVISFGTNNTERARISSAGGFSVGTTADPGAGAIYATGAITAYYSDARLKDVKGTITDALDKVSSLSGVYYTNNEVAVAHGYTSAETQVGLLAQDVEAVLPEVVKAAPFDLDEKGNSKSGEHYKTVQYERIIPLLVEAIKELRAEIQALRG